MTHRFLAVLVAVALLPGPASAQLFRRKPPEPAPVVEIAPPPPTPKEYWESRYPDPTDAEDPLGERRATRQELAASRTIDNGVDPLLYRLWGLPPLQTQLVREGEAILETWVRPSGGVRQAIIRITLRRDGRTFLQVRAGLACCKPEIVKRITIDEELPAGAGEAFAQLARLEVWNQPREIRMRDPDVGVVEGVCVNGVAYDVTLVTATRDEHLRRSCDPVEVGSIASVVQPTVAAVWGRNPYVDYLFPRGADFSSDLAAYRSFSERGGKIEARPRG
jgi:hypothetical protein